MTCDKHKGELVPGWVTCVVFASVSECMCDLPEGSFVLKLLAINLQVLCVKYVGKKSCEFTNLSLLLSFKTGHYQSAVK